MDWQKLSEEQVKVGYRWVTKKQFLFPDGRQAEYTTWDKTATTSAATVAVTKEGMVVIARQYRPGPECQMMDLPGGLVETGEDYSLAAARELVEETGYVSDEPLIPIGCNRGDAYSNNTNYYFLARNCYKAQEQVLDANEFVEVVEISVAELLQNAKTGMMTDPAAVLCAYEYLKDL